MGGVVDSAEHEERFVLTRAQVTRFFAAIGARATLETYDRARPVAYTRTTYFDTDDLLYLQSCAGPIARRLRLREYAMAASLEDVPILSSIACLELKQNAGTARSKVRLQATPTLLRHLIERRGQHDAEVASLEPLSALATLAQQLAIPSMAPRLTTWYRRAAMNAESGRLRITLDERLTFCRPQIVGVIGAEVAPSPADVIAPGPARILEIKHWGDRPVWLTWALDGLQPAHDFSKFRTGMAAMTRKLQPFDHPYAAADGGAAADLDADADTDTAVDISTYFAPSPGTA
jgi:VTC domain-containing protein